MCSQDTSDNYAANCFSDIKWGEVKTYEMLCGVQNDKEAFLTIEAIFKHLYPQTKTVVGWRGDSITIDWRYVASEMWEMARMRRWEDDDVSFAEAWSKVVGTDNG
jgi:4'-phosphopantetheinyl transferase EntD